MNDRKSGDAPAASPCGIDAQLRQHAPLVRRLAAQMAGRLPANVERDDLVQVGMIGLWDALRSYEPGHGTEFETFATYRIKGAMLDEVRAMDWIGRRARRDIRSADAARQRLEHHLLRAPSEAEIAQEVGMSLADFQAIQGRARRAQIVFFDDLNEQDEATVASLSLSPQCNPEAIAAARQEARAAEAAMQSLGDKHRIVVDMLEQGATMEAIGAACGVTASAVSARLVRVRELGATMMKPPASPVVPAAIEPEPVRRCMLDWSGVRWG